MSQWQNPPPVVVLSGTHGYLRRRELKEAIVVAESMGRTIERVQGDDRDELSRILSSTGILFKEKTLVVIENPDKVDAELVLKHHESGDSTTVLILHHTDQIKRKGNLGKLVKELPSRLVAKFEKPKPWEEADHAAVFCVNEARKQRVKLSDPLARGIVQSMGSNLGVLAFEIQKLGMFLRAHGETEVTKEHVLSTIAGFTELGPGPIVEALERRDRRAATRALSSMRRTHVGNLGSATLLACGWVGRSLVRWLHTAALNERGHSVEEIASRVGAHEFVVRKTLLPVARRWGRGRLTSLLKSIAAVKRAVRGGHVHPWIEFECALFRSLQEGPIG